MKNATNVLKVLSLVPLYLVFAVELTGCVVVSDASPPQPSSFRSDFTEPVMNTRMGLALTGDKLEQSGTKLNMSQFAALDRSLELLASYFPTSSLDTRVTTDGDVDSSSNSTLRKISSSSERVRVREVRAWKVCNFPSSLDNITFTFDGGALSISPADMGAYVSYSLTADYYNLQPQYESRTDMVVSTSTIKLRNAGYDFGRCNIHYAIRFDEMSSRNLSAFTMWRQSLRAIRDDLARVANDTSSGYHQPAELKRLSERVQLAYDSLP